MNRTLRVVAILALVALLLPAIVSACPLCKDAEADTPGGTVGFGRGIYYSILLMIAVPWTAVGTIAFLIFRKRRLENVAGTGPAGLHPPQSLAGTGPAGLQPPQSLAAVPQSVKSPVELVPEPPGARP
jgi:hypothetical protein